jgi:hypothetical protein
MQAARIRLLIAVLLFVGWLGWLGYLAATSGDEIVLSRPQLLVASAQVIAELAPQASDPVPSPSVTITEVVWATGQAKQLEVGETITITNLERCGPAQGWSGRGRYILPLSKTARGYAITPIPPSPGYLAFPSPGSRYDPRLRIYPATPHTERQLQAINETQTRLFTTE